MSNAQYGLFDKSTGVRVQFQLDWTEEDGGSFDEFCNSVGASIQVALANGYVLAQADTLPAVEKAATTDGTEIHEIVGVVFGKGMDTKLKKVMPRLYLYLDHRPYSAYTIFHEKIDTLPPAIQQLAAPLVAQPMIGELQAPEKQAVINSGIYHQVNFKVVVEPMKDDSGAVKKNQGGYTLFKYVSSVDGAPPAPTQQPAPSTQPTVEIKLAARSTLNTLHALGTCMYADDWDNKRASLVAYAGSKRVPRAELTSSNELSEAEATQLIKGIEGKIRDGLAILLNTMQLSTDAAKQIIKTTNNHKIDTLDGLFGVPLTKAADKINALFKEWQEKFGNDSLDADIPF